MNSNKLNWVTLAGWAGLAGAVLVGIGEFSMQFTLGGGIEDTKDYLYFNDISQSRLTIGHFISILSAPLYLLGYWHLSKKLEPAGKTLSQIFFFVGAYAFAVGTAWIGQRFFLATTVHAIADGAEIHSLLETFSAHNEPLVNVLRVAMLVVSIIWVLMIVRGGTEFPKWMAFFNPILLLATMFALYFLKTTVGQYVFPVAMNATHVVLFSLSLLTGLRHPRLPDAD